MRFSKPSPSMAVSVIALFVALGGTSVAAVSFARNAGKVDGRSAVSASASLDRAAGRLVATRRRGAEKGRIPGRFLAGVSHARAFGIATEVVDNTAGAPSTQAVTRLGTLTATCNDQSARAGVEDPISQLNFNNSSGNTVNLADHVGNAAANVGVLANGTAAPLTVSGSNTFEYFLQQAGLDVRISGVVRQDGRGTPTASCVVWGTVQSVG
jgi:hypothetical protein